MKNNFLIILVNALLLIFCQAVSARIIYVSIHGDDKTSDGSQLKPYNSIQHALNKAIYGDTIQVGKGTYYENIVWPAVRKIKLIGSGEGVTIITDFYRSVIGSIF
jgi:hypothetical protein